MEELDRRAAVAVKTLERPDVRALRSQLDAVAVSFDALVEAQDDEIERLRRLIVTTVARYRAVTQTKWNSVKKTNALIASLDTLCLEADAMLFAGDLLPRKRPARRRTNAPAATVLGGGARREG